MYISDAPHLVRVEWQAATAAGANNGSLALYVDETLKQTLSGKDNDTRRVDYARLGATSGIDSGTRGTIYLDGYRVEDYETHTQGEYLYDGDGNRVRASENGAQTIFVAAHFEWTAAGSTKYYSAGGVIAFRREGYAADNGLFWLLSDHLGSATRVLAADGTPREQALYRAWGEVRLGEITLTDLSFTGQRMAVAGLTFFKARFYDSLSGRFAQADSIVPGAGNPLAWDRYAAMNNNAVANIDPTGHICIRSGNRNLCSDDDDSEQYYSLPAFNDIPSVIPSKESEGSVTPETRNATKSAYVEIRTYLFFHYGYRYVDHTGKIRDYVLMALILAGEANYDRGSSNSNEREVANEVLEALSNQYNDPDFSSHCGPSGCSIVQQIAWLFTMEFVRNPTVRGTAMRTFTDKIPDGILAQQGFSYGEDESWFWGNVADVENSSYDVVAWIKNGFYAPPYKQDDKPYFIVYRR